MAPKLSPKNRPPFLCLHTVPYLPKPGVHLLALHTEFLLTGLAKENELSRSILTTVMCESKEIKGVGSSALLACPLSFKSAKADYASLLRM
jgi:hypothetical protein